MHLFFLHSTKQIFNTDIFYSQLDVSHWISRTFIKEIKNENANKKKNQYKKKIRILKCVYILCARQGYTSFKSCKDRFY